jgi:hypothetical protein
LEPILNGKIIAIENETGMTLQLSKKALKILIPQSLLYFIQKQKKPLNNFDD